MACLPWHSLVTRVTRHTRWVTPVPVCHRAGPWRLGEERQGLVVVVQ
jgi:hypothetical protein